MNATPRKLLPLLLMLCCLFLSACGDQGGQYDFDAVLESAPASSAQSPVEEPGQNQTAPTEAADLNGDTESGGTSEYPIDVNTLPEFDGSAYIEINGNIPFFPEEDKNTQVFEAYSDLDELGRCGAAYANISVELMPTEKRGSISEVHPTGWHSSRYDFVDGASLYNRSHLIAFQLAGENANEKNLITGTRFLNDVGMRPFEEMVGDYVRATDTHVLYRVTPIFEGDNLLASGVLMEAWSVEDAGESICYCIYIYNCQPGVEIDYATGDNWLDTTESSGGEDYTLTVDDGAAHDYVLNTSSQRFHLPDCTGVDDISPGNRSDYTGTRASLIERGYTPCSICNP